jgi:hypothetical protein
MEAKAREMFPGAPEKAKATIDELRQRATAWDKSESEFITQNKNAVGQLVMAGKSVKEITTSSAFLALPGGEQQQVRDALTDRSYVLGQRSRTLQIQAEEDLARKNAPAFFEYSDPRKLQNMTRAEVESLWTKIGINNTNSLLQKWDSLQNKVEGSNIIGTEDLIKGSAIKLGILPATGKPNNDQALAFINYQRAVAEKVNSFEATELLGRKQASPDQVRRIVQQMEIDKVYVEGFFSNKQKSTFTITPQEMPKAYVNVLEGGKSVEVPVSLVPPGQRKAIMDALKVAGEPVNEQTIVQWWVDHGRKPDPTPKK